GPALRCAGATPPDQSQAASAARGRGLRALPRAARAGSAHRAPRAEAATLRDARHRRGPPPLVRGQARRARAARASGRLTTGPQTTRVGWIGTGVMGVSMCGHVLAAGYPVTVYSRTRERAEPLLERGATWAGSPAAVAAASDVVFSIVGYPADVRAVILGDEGALEGAAPGSVLVDMTTSEPSLAIEI